MDALLNKMISEAKKLPLVPPSAAGAYQKSIPDMVRHVDEALAALPEIDRLIGGNPRQMMYDNHRHHAAFMATVFILGNYELLARTVPWVYRAYGGRNFSHDYFLEELDAWQSAVETFLGSGFEEIQAVYVWMIRHHDQMMILSRMPQTTALPISPDWLERKTAFLSALLSGDHRKCLEIAETAIHAEADVASFYLQIVQPVMVELGLMWEQGAISVAREHLASAIVGRVMAMVSVKAQHSMKRSGKAVITAAPNEFHEIGAWMISDILEQEGWEVRYLGANTPAADLLALMREFKPDILALSVTMPFNIVRSRDLIAAVRDDKDLASVRIMVGGRAFNETPDLWRATGADGFAANLAQAKEVADAWRK